MTKRTDVHRPSDMDPQAYQFYACGWNGQWGLASIHPKLEALKAMGTEVFPGAHSDNCTHCGAAIKYYAIFVHIPTMEYIYVGEICMNNRFEAGLDKGEFQELRRQAKLGRERMKKSEKIAKLVEAHPLLTELTYYKNYMATAFATNAEMDRGDFSGEYFMGDTFLNSIARQLSEYGELSDRQVAAAERAIPKALAAIQRRCDDVVKKASGAVKKVPTGLTTLVGKVLWHGWESSPFGPGEQHRMLVLSDEGYKITMTVPAAISADVEKDTRISVDVTTKPKTHDEFAGYGSRPVRGTAKVVTA